MPVHVKICGLTTTATMNTALDAGADYVGLMFFPPSPRNIRIDEAATLANRARGKARIVSVFVDPGDSLLDAVIAKVRPDVIQLHGHETPERIAEIRSRSPATIMKAIQVETRDDVISARQYRDCADMILFDAKAPSNAALALPGGNGDRFDWRMLEVHDHNQPWMLSAGLNPGNVAAAIVATGATAVDVSSGVERSRGEKDVSLIAAFLTAAKNAKSQATVATGQGAPDHVDA